MPASFDLDRIWPGTTTGREPRPALSPTDSKGLTANCIGSEAVPALAFRFEGLGLTDLVIARLLTAAAAAQRSGEAATASRLWEDVLKLAPEHPEALNSLGVQALARGDAGGAAILFTRAAASDPGEPALWLNLAKAQRTLGDDEAERASLDRALTLDRRHFMALVRKAQLHQRLGEDAQAAKLWGGVLSLAAALERKSPELEQMLGDARSFVGARSGQLATIIARGLEAERKGIDAAAVRRFDACIDHVLGRRPIYVNQCAGIHFPFLPADEFLPNGHFPWMTGINAATVAIREELERLLDEDGGEGFEPYVATPPGTPADKWTELDHSPRWSAYYLWQYGRRNEEACARCPATAAALAAVPLADLPGRAPTAFFSLLQPRTRIPPHTGVSNTRTIIHLPLIIPDGCGFRVGGETRQWRVGEAFAFDDTIEHEAWNESDELRAVLIFDVWNPHLTATEQKLLRSFYNCADASGHNPEPLET